MSLLRINTLKPRIYSSFVQRTEIIRGREIRSIWASNQQRFVQTSSVDDLLQFKLGVGEKSKSNVSQSTQKRDPVKKEAKEAKIGGGNVITLV